MINYAAQFCIYIANLQSQPSPSGMHIHIGIITTCVHITNTSNQTHVQVLYFCNIS